MNGMTPSDDNEPDRKGPLDYLAAAMLGLFLPALWILLIVIECG